MKTVYPAACLAFTILCTASARAQIDMAAIAQFKYNQQQAQAQSFARNRPESRTAKHRGNAPVITLIDKPAIIHARNPKFKTIPGSDHKSNVR